jgi:hypothetical protein
MGKWPPSLGIRTGGGRETAAVSLTTLLKVVEKFLLVETKALPGRRTNGKAIFRATIGSNGHKCEI